MSQTIENQIVKMQFDNKGFEKGAQESMNTLDKLKKMLHFDKVDMTPLQKAFAETEATATKAGFHIRDIWLKVANTIEDQIANKIVDAGKKIFNALSLEGITDGFKEYELKMGSIQTIMAGTGESLATVNKYLDELNTYSDQTIYSFSDMTQSIGKFTNAGVKLKDAVNAIKGIANEAAVSGANSNEASRAMYNFAQALSAGYVKLIDWKSIENANMATVEFKDTLLRMGVACKTVKKESGGMYQVLTKNAQGKSMDDIVNGTKNFNDSLQYQWMTTDVLTKTLEIYATDVRKLTAAEKEEYETKLKKLGYDQEEIIAMEQLGIKAANSATEIKTFTMLIDTLKEAIGSGWAMSWQYFIGDFEQAKAVFTDVGNTLGGMIDAMSDARNRFLKNGLQTGWERFTTMNGKAIPESEKYREILLKTALAQNVLTKEQVVNITSTNDLVKSMHELKWVTGDLLVTSVDDYTKTLESMSKEERDAAGVTDAQLSELKALNKFLQANKVRNKEFINSLAKGMNELGGRENIIASLKNLFESLSASMKPVGEAFDKVFGTSDPTKLFNLTAKFREFTEQMKVSEDAANTIRTSFTLAFGGIKTVLDTVITAFRGVTKLILPAFNLFDALFGLIGKIVAALTGSNGAVEAAHKFADIQSTIGGKYLDTMQKLADIINKVAEAIRGVPDATVFKKISSAVDKAKSSIKEFWQSFTELPVIQEMVADFNNTIDAIDAKLSPVAAHVNAVINDVKQSISKFFTWDSFNKNLTIVYTKVKQFMSMVKGFADRIKLFFTNLKAGKSVVDSFKESFGDIIKQVKDLKDKIFKFFEDLFSKGDELGTKFDLNEIQEAIHSFVQNITPDQITMIAVAGSFMLIALNLLKLSDALKNALDSFTGIGTALKNVINSYVKKQKSTIVQVAESIVIVAAALWVLSTIPKDDLENAKKAMIAITACIGALTIALAGAGIALQKLGGGQSFVKLASGLAVVSGALLAAVLAMKVLEFVDLGWDIIPKILALTGIMTVMVGMSYLLSKLDRFQKGSLTMIAVAGSLLIAAEAMARISTVPSEKIDEAVNTLYKLMVGLGVLAFASSKVGVFSAVGLIALVLTFDKLIPSIENMVTYDYSKINKGLTQNQVMLKKLGGLLLIMTTIGMIAGNRIKGAGIAFLSMSATFAILVGVAKLAGMLKPTELARGEEFIIKMAGIMALLELCSARSKLGMWGGKNGGEGGKIFIKLAATMAILLGVAKMASMMDVAALAKGELAMVGLIGLTAALIGVAKLAQKSEGVISSVSKMLIAVSLVLGMVAVLAIVPMENMKTSLAAVITVIGALAVLAFAMSRNVKVFDKATQASASSVAAFITSAAMIAICGYLIYALSKETPKNVMAAAGAIAGVTVAISVLAAAIGNIKEDNRNINQWTSAIETIVMVAIIGQILAKLGKYIQDSGVGAKKLVATAGAVSMVLLAITPALHVLSGFDDNSKIAPAATSAALAIGALIVVAGAVGLLSNYGGDSKKMVASAIAVSIALIAICAPIAVLGAVGKYVNTIDAKSLGSVIGGAIVALAGVSAALIAVSNMGGDSDKLIASAQALSIALFGLCLPIAVLGAVGQLCKTARPEAMWGAMGGAVVALWGVASILSNFANMIDIDAINRINAALPALTAVMTSVSVMSIALAAAGDVAMLGGGGASIIAGLGAVSAVMIALAEAVVGIALLGAAIENSNYHGEALEKGLDTLVIIFNKLGEAVGALISGFGLGLTANLDQIADRLNSFSEKIIPFSENMRKVSGEAVTGCKNLAGAMLYLTAAEFLDGLGKIFGLGTINLTFFGELGEAVAAFSNSVKGVSPDAISKASICSVIAKRLAEINSSLDAKGGLAGAIFGEKDLGGFARAIKTFGFGIKEFCKSVSDLPENSVQLAQNAADASGPIITMTRSLVAQGGLWQKIVGEKDLSRFGTSLIAFGAAINGFVTQLKLVEEISPVYPQMIQKCADATTPMVDLANGIQNSGGKLAEWLGDNTLDVFGKTLVPFARGLKSFVFIIKAMASEVPNYKTLITDVTEASTQLVTLANNIDDMGGLKAIVEGDNRLDLFGETLTNFGSSMVSFVTIVEGTDYSILDTLVASTDKFVTLADRSSKIPLDAFTNVSTALHEIASLPIDMITSNWIQNTPNLAKEMGTMLTTIRDVARDRKTVDRTVYYAYGTMVDAAIADGIKRNLTVITGALDSLVSSMKKKLDDSMKSSSFEDYGKNVAVGLKLGIEKNADSVKEASASMAKQVKDAIPKELEENSPSRASYRFGKYLDIGLGNGVSDYTSYAVKATTKMSDQVVETANTIISAISNAIDSDMDTQPVIRPVLDTTGIERGVRGVNKLFDSSDLNIAYRASSGVKQISANKTAVVEAKNNDTPVATQEISFTQNNYSPKALSPIEIYRQTKNQISMLKGVNTYA